MVERYLAEQPLPEADLIEEIWRRLPWKSAAAAGPDALDFSAELGDGQGA